MNDQILMQWSFPDEVQSKDAGFKAVEAGLFFELRAEGVSLVEFNGALRAKVSYMMVVFDDSFSQAMGRASLGNRLPLDSDVVESTLGRMNQGEHALLYALLSAAELSRAERGRAEFDLVMGACLSASQAEALDRETSGSESKRKPGL